MQCAKPVLSCVVAALLAGCASNTPDAPKAGKQADFETLKTASCPDDVTFILPEKLKTTVTAIGWGEGADEKFAPVKPLQVYEISSEDVRIGGLSGLDFLDSDTLLSVTDKGDLVWIDIEPETGKPTESVYLTFLKSGEGKPLDGKLLGDSEGVAWNGEYAFVSFERDHRIWGYDIEGCGANARGVDVVHFPNADFGVSETVKPNSGMEALADFGDGLVAGLETRIKDLGALASMTPDKPIAFDPVLPLQDVTLLVGLDIQAEADGTGRIYALTRSYDPFRGNQIGLVTATLGLDGKVRDPKSLFFFGKPFTVDNFEGIAVQRREDGTDRIFIISDDNFSPKQRTLLGVLDYDPKS